MILLALSIISARYLFAEIASASKKEYKLTRLFPLNEATAITFDASIIAGLTLDGSDNQENIIVPISNGAIAAVNSRKGDLEWRLEIPSAKNQQIQLAATPVKIGNKLVVIYQCVENGVRVSHRMAVIDLIAKSWDENFPALELSANKPAADGKSTVKFNPPTAYSRAALKHAYKKGSLWGMVYAGFGNAGDAQPFHGWLFEIDMDAWFNHVNNKIISTVLSTTPEPECPVTVEHGTQEMICGGGIWAPAGPQIYPTNDGYEIFAPTGNGQVDLERHDYANTLLRLKPGLQFNPECDELLCRNFDPVNPDEACLSSCKNLFIPRLPVDAPPLHPAGGECNTKSFAECLAWMDYDLGGSPPVKAKLPDGKEVLVQPGKDGAVYLIDARQLGIQYDRLQIAALCGTAADPCKAGWMGMIVTQPVISHVNSTPVVVVPTFAPDNSHPAGIVALKIIVEDGKPKFKRFWQFPQPKSRDAIKAFRSHPSFPVIAKPGKSQDDVVWVVDTGNPGKLYGIRIKDGALLIAQSLLGAGRQLSAPIIHNNNIYLASVFPGNGKTFVEAYQIETIGH